MNTDSLTWVAHRRERETEQKEENAYFGGCLLYILYRGSFVGFSSPWGFPRINTVYLVIFFLLVIIDMLLWFWIEYYRIYSSIWNLNNSMFFSNTLKVDDVVGVILLLFGLSLSPMRYSSEWVCVQIRIIAPLFINIEPTDFYPNQVGPTKLSRTTSPRKTQNNILY